MSEIDPHALDFVPGERLFLDQAADWQELTAAASTTTDGVPYAYGFNEAGDMLVNQGISTHMQDFVAFPALFCYRHALELVMKQVVYEGQLAIGEPIKMIGHHKLLEIWRDTRATLERAWPDGNVEQLDAMESIVAELAEVDPFAEQFRYDRDRRGFVRELPVQLRRFNLRHVSTVMGKLLAVLRGAIDGIEDMRMNAEQERDIN